MRLFLIIAIVTSWFWPVDGYADSPQLLPENHRPTEPKISLTLPALPRREHEMLPIERLIENLDAGDAQTRRGATFDLQYIGEKALPLLKEAAKKGKTSNLRHSATAIIEEIEKPVVLDWNQWPLWNHVRDSIAEEFRVKASEACKKLEKVRAHLWSVDKFPEIEASLLKIEEEFPRPKRIAAAIDEVPGAVQALKQAGFVADTDFYRKYNPPDGFDFRYGREWFALRVVRGETGAKIYLYSGQLPKIKFSLVPKLPESTRRRPQYPEVPAVLYNGLRPSDYSGIEVSPTVRPAMDLHGGPCEPGMENSYQTSFGPGTRREVADAVSDLDISKFFDLRKIP